MNKLIVIHIVALGLCLGCNANSTVTEDYIVGTWVTKYAHVFDGKTYDVARVLSISPDGTWKDGTIVKGVDFDGTPGVYIGTWDLGKDGMFITKITKSNLSFDPEEIHKAEMVYLSDSKMMLTYSESKNKETYQRIKMDEIPDELLDEAEGSIFYQPSVSDVPPTAKTPPRK